MIALYLQYLLDDSELVGLLSKGSTKGGDFKDSIRDSKGGIESSIGRDSKNSIEFRIGINDRNNGYSSKGIDSHNDIDSAKSKNGEQDSMKDKDIGKQIIHECFDYSYYTKNVDSIFKRVFG